MPEVECSVCLPEMQQPAPTTKSSFRMPSPLQQQPTAAVLPPKLWQQIWGDLDKAFFPVGGHPSMHMTGACKCGKLQFRVDGNLAASFLCHCHMCRRHWCQGTPAHVLWVQPETALTFTAGREYLQIRIVEKLENNLRGSATVNFCKECGTNINVEFSDPNATFTLMWPYNFSYSQWGDLSGKGDKARHGYSEILRPRFHAHYENRAMDAQDDLLKLADVWLEGMPLMNNTGGIVGKVTQPMPGYENGWISAQAIVVNKGADKKETLQLKNLPLGDFPAGDVIVQVEASTINYKDGLAVTGAGGIMRKFPMVPGIDMSGTVSDSSHPSFKVGDKVLLNGYGASEVNWGGFSTIWRGSGDHLLHVPQTFSTQQAMAIGTGGYTAMLCVLALEQGGCTPDKGEILVTGACGGVGTIAVALLSKLGYNVCALTGRAEETEFLKKLGASSIMSREELSSKKGPLGKERFAGVVDSVGSKILVNALSQTKYLGVVAACGLAQGSDLPGSVLPFILRGVSLVGIDSVQAPKEMRKRAWERLAQDLDVSKLETICTSPAISLHEVPAAGAKILAGQIRGRLIVDMTKPIMCDAVAPSASSRPPAIKKIASTPMQDPAKQPVITVPVNSKL